MVRSISGELSGAPKSILSAQNRSGFRRDRLYLCEFSKQILDFALLVRAAEAGNCHITIIPYANG